MAIDFSAYDKKVAADKEIANANLGKISDITERYALVKQEIEEAEKTLSDLKIVKKQIEERDLPNAMLDVNLNKVELSSGTKITVSDFVYTSIPANKKEDAYLWLEDHGYGEMIKEKIILDSKDQREDIVQTLEGLGVGFEEKRDIHYQTLNKLGRELVDSGSEPPPDLFKLHKGKVAKIK